MIGILIVAGIRLYREGLAQLFVRETEMTVVATYARRRDVPGSLALASVDVILLDMTEPDAHDTACPLSDGTRPIPLVAIGISDSDADVIACAEAGAAAYVTRDGSIEELVSTVRSAAKGELICSPRIAGSLARRVGELAATRKAAGRQGRLTRREREIATLLQQDLSNKEIATRLRIEVATVKNHVHNLLDKLNAHSRLEASRSFAQSSR